MNFRSFYLALLAITPAGLFAQSLEPPLPTTMDTVIVRGSAAELAARYADSPPKGEIVLVIAPAGAGPSGSGRSRRASARDSPPDPAALDALRKLVDAGAHPRKAASIVASLTGTSANSLYRALTSE